MEPMHSVSYDLEFQKQLPTSKGSSRKPLVDVPADEAKMKPPVTEIALAFVFFAGLMTFGLASFFFLQSF